MNKPKLTKKLTEEYKCVFKEHDIIAFKRPHGAWCCQISYKGVALYSEGYHGRSLKSLEDVEKYIESKLAEH